MIASTPRFAGFAFACVAGVAASFGTQASAQAQHDSLRLPGALDPAFGAAMRSTVSGIVRDRGGQPQIGALIQLLNAQYQVIAQTFTDDRGRYVLPRLAAGEYQIEASNALFLPTIRPDLRLLRDSRVVVNLTLSTLYQALQWLPAEPREASTPSDDWSWTLRLSANRPLLRMVDPGTAQAAGGANEPLVVESSVGSSHLRQVAVHSGLARFGEGGVAQGIAWQAVDNDTRAVLFAAETAAGSDGLTRASTSAAYHQQLSPDGSMTTVLTFIDRPGIRSGDQSGLATVRVRSASTVRLGDLAELNAGTELAVNRLGNGSANAASFPFAVVRVHAAQTVLSYNVATSPTMTDAARLEESSAADDPSLSGAALHPEQGLHQGVAITRKAGGWTGEVAGFYDALARPVVQGAVGPSSRALLGSSDVLYDPGTGLIAVSGQSYSGGGVMALLRDQLSPETWFSLSYALGEAVTLPTAAAAPSTLPAFADERASMAAAVAQTRLPASGTEVRGSYRWQPSRTLTQVAPFAADVPPAYVSLLVRQPVHMQRLGVGKIDAILDVRNLLAQGYRPFLSQDGTTVYFAQAQRCIAAGFSFSF